MNTIKSLILGSAAALLAVGGAQAADLPVKAKAVEYVKVCSLYGAGFYYVPGTDTCLRFGGYVRADVTFNGSGAHGGPGWSGDVGAGDRFKNDFIERTRMQLQVDSRTATEYGVVRTFGMLDIQQSTLGGGAYSPATTTNNLSASPVLDTAGSGTVVPEQLFIQFAGFTFGKSFSAFSSPWGNYAGNQLSSYFSGASDTSVGVNNIQYTAQFGNGVSATIGLDDPSTFNRTSLYNLNLGVGVTGTSSNTYAGVRLPDVNGNVKFDQAWGLFQLSAGLHEVDASYNTLGAGGVPTNLSQVSGHPSTAYGGSVQAALQIKNLPTGPGDDIRISGVYAKGDTKNVFSVSGGASPNFAMYGGSSLAGAQGSLAFGGTTDGVFLPAANGGDGNIHLTTAYGFQGGFQHNFDAHWNGNLFGGMSYLRYDSVAAANICAAYAANTGGLATQTNNSAAGTYTCNPNYMMTQLGANLKWTPVAGLTFSAETIWAHLGTNFSGFATLTPAAPLPTGIYQFKGQNTVELEFRAQRNF